MDLVTVKVEKPEAVGVILGQAHFIKTVEDLHEAMVNAVPGIRFGVAFCEASGDRLVRASGTDDGLRELATLNALTIGAGHTFVVCIGEGSYPLNVLNAVKAVPEVATVFCATNNPLEVVVAVTELGRGVVGVIDGLVPQGVEDGAGVEWRKNLLRAMGYKL